MPSLYTTSAFSSSISVTSVDGFSTMSSMTFPKAYKLTLLFSLLIINCTLTFISRNDKHCVMWHFEHSSYSESPALHTSIVLVQIVDSNHSCIFQHFEGIRILLLDSSSASTTSQSPMSFICSMVEPSLEVDRNLLPR